MLVIVVSDVIPTRNSGTFPVVGTHVQMTGRAAIALGSLSDPFSANRPVKTDAG